MGFAKTIRKAVAIADRLTADMQVTVQHHCWIGNDSVYGTPLYATPVARQAIVEMKQRTLRLSNGQEILQRASIYFLRPITANGATDRVEPVDIRDKFVLPNGYTGPVKNVEGLENNFPDSPYLVEVMLG